MLLVYLPHTYWNPNLRIVTFRTAYNIEIVLQQLVQPFFYNSFSVATSDADYG